MSTWAGWVTDFLNIPALTNTPPNQTFMEQWSAHDATQCKNAPITLSTVVAGSSRCGNTVTPLGRTQQYNTRAHAVHAWSLQIELGVAKPIKDAINTGNPFQINDRAPVVAALKTWGSPSFADWYKNATSSGGTGTGGNPSTRAPHTHSGYHDLQHVMEHHLPSALRQSGKLTDAALRSLSHGRTVKR